jgi:maltose-binding protein MalE
MIRRLSILAAAAALAVSAAPAVAATSNTDTGQPSTSYDMSSPYLKQAAADHAEGTVSIWNNGDGNDLITLEHEGLETSTAVVVLIGANNYG